MDEKVYSEIFSILKMLGKKYINSIPQEIINVIENSMDKKYQPMYNIDNISNEKIRFETLSVIAYLNTEYWHEIIDDNNMISILFEN